MSDPSRIAVVGCGNISSMHLEGIAAHPDRAVVVAAVDPAADRREWARSEWGVPHVYATVEELLQDSGTPVDAAVVSTPSHVRYSAVEALAEAGVAILVEKPLADSLEEAQRIADLAARTGTVIGVDQNFRDHYAFGLARDAIRAGEIGEVYAIDQRELLFREVEGWRAEARRHALAVMGVHWFDGFRYLLPEDADWLICRLNRSPAVVAAGETDAFVQIHFGGAVVNYAQSFASRVERVETVVLGTEGTLLLTYDTLTVATATGTRTAHNPFAGDGKPESAFRRLDEVLEAAASGTEPPNSVADNLKTLSLLIGAYRSAETGEPVRLSEGILQ